MLASDEVEKDGKGRKTVLKKKTEGLCGRKTQ